nr:MAG TPA: hypothetical protein [Caudoviricetes sp.]
MEHTITVQDLIEKILKLAEMSESHMLKLDAWRTGICTKEACGMAAVLELLGVDILCDDHCVDYTGGGYRRINYLFVEGVMLINRTVIDWKAYTDAAKEHHWDSRALTIIEREKVE